MTNRSDAYVVDTHALIWRFGDEPRLPQRIHEVFDAAEHGELRLLVPTIVLAELQHLYEGRMPEIRLQSILNTVLNIPSCTVTPFDLQVFLLARSLPQHLQIHDRVIGATGRLYGVPVITRDGRLRDQVETFW